MMKYVDKLDEKIKEYGRGTPCSDDAELIAAVGHILADELEKPEEQRDYDLIDEAVGTLAALRGDSAALDGAATRCADRAKGRAKKGKRPAAALKLIIPVATVAVLAAFSVMLAFGRTDVPDTVPGSEILSTGTATDGTGPGDIEPSPGSVSLTVIPQSGGLGSEDGLVYDIRLEVSDGGVRSSELAEQTFSVFYFRYGNGQGGPYEKLTAEDNEAIKKRATDVAVAVFGEDAASHMTVTDGAVAPGSDVAFTVTGTFDDESQYAGCSLMSTMYYTSVVFSEGSVRAQSEEWDEMLTSAVRFAGIGSERLTAYSGGQYGSDRVHFLIEDGENDPAESGCLAEVSYTVNVEEGDVSSICVTNVGFTEKAEETTLPSADEAISYLKKEYDGSWRCDADDEVIIDRVYRETEGEVGGRRGVYYLPAYRIFVPDVNSDGLFAEVYVIAKDPE